MRTIEVKLYQFKELSDEAKEKAIESLYYVNVDYEWWDSTYEDASQAGLKITEFDIGRSNYCKGEFIEGAAECADKIKDNHGETCTTHETAKEFMNERDNLVAKYSDGIHTDRVTEDNEAEFDEDCDELEAEFLKSILEDYRIILQKEYEYQTEEKAIIETIEANEYEFTEEGIQY